MNYNNAPLHGGFFLYENPGEFSPSAVGYFYNTRRDSGVGFRTLLNPRGRLP